MQSMDEFKDLISDDEASQIQSDSQKAIEESTRGFDKEGLRKAFQKGNPRLVRLNEAAANHDGKPPVNYKPRPKYICTLEQSRLPFFKCYKQRVGKRPILTNNNADVVRNVIKWLLTDDTGPYDLSQGLFIYGDYGTGKTDLLYTMKQFSYIAGKQFDNVLKLPVIQSYKFMLQKAQEQKSIKGLYKTTGISMIDDLGFLNDNQLKIYGNTTNAMNDIIDARYRTWKGDKDNVSIFTSNLDLEFILEHHGEGIGGRLYEMCNIIHWDGESFRMKKGNNE